MLVFVWIPFVCLTLSVQGKKKSPLFNLWHSTKQERSWWQALSLDPRDQPAAYCFTEIMEEKNHSIPFVRTGFPIGHQTLIVHKPQYKEMMPEGSSFPYVCLQVPALSESGDGALQHAFAVNSCIEGICCTSSHLWHSNKLHSPPLPANLAGLLLSCLPLALK